jgi:fumarate hydratase subunit alpha
MRTITAAAISDAVRAAAIEAAVHASPDLVTALERAAAAEESDLGRDTLRRLLDNCRIAAEQGVPICQDTGLAVFFVERGEGVTVDGVGMNAAIADGVRRGYADGYLRKSSCHCLTRKNFGDNNPPIIHTEIVPGDRLRLFFLAKGGGSENMSAVGMLKPAQGEGGIVDFVTATVERAGANPCPPIIVGVGIGGTFERAALNSKRALLRKIGAPSLDPDAARMEAEMLRRVNALGIGPEGFGGRITALAVHVIIEPCHLASLPVAVNLQCHANRHRTIEL